MDPKGLADPKNRKREDLFETSGCFLKRAFLVETSCLFLKRAFLFEASGFVFEASGVFETSSVFETSIILKRAFWGNERCF